MDKTHKDRGQTVAGQTIKRIMQRVEEDEATNGTSK